MRELKLGFFQRRRNLTEHNFVVLSNFWSNDYFDSFDEARDYALNIRSKILRSSNNPKKKGFSYYNKGYSIYVWDKKKWYMIERWTY